MPAIESTFRTDQPSLGDLLDDITKGKIQLPDFQRGWVWDDVHIRALIASISLGYPIGALTFMETGGENVRFKPRVVHGVELETPCEPDQLILDGQQRLTSLYLALQSGKPVPTTTTTKKKIDRYYYLDMHACLEPEADRYEAILSLPAEKQIKSDFGRKIELDVSTADKEYAHGLFPLQLVFDNGKTSEWKMGFQEYFDYDKDKIRFLNRFEHEIWLRFQKYKIPVIEILKETPKEAVCQVFEHVNQGGVPLTVFELMTATFAADDFQLRKDWDGRKRRIHRHATLAGVDESSFLTAITLLASYKRQQAAGTAVSCKRKDILQLTLDEYTENADAITQGMVMAAQLLAREKVFEAKNLPYQTQLIPLSAICAMLGERFEEDPIKRKLARWYWCGVFGELYGGANESRYALDIQHVLAWIQGEIEEPATVRDANFAPTRLLTLQSRLSAAYKGVFAQLIEAGSHDFINGDAIVLTNYFDKAVDIHHIFPSAHCQKMGHKRIFWNSVINKAPLTSRTNRILGGNAPSTYIRTIENSYSVEPQHLDTHLESHLIAPGLLRNDKFELFIRDRAANLLDLIEKAMGKSISGRDSDEVVGAFGDSLLR